MSATLFEIKDAIGFITFNRPEKYNAVNRELALQLQEHLDACTSREVRCVYITGAGKAFSSGQDLMEAIGADGPNTSAILKEQYAPLIRKIRSLEKPVVAAVNGIAAGAAANLALCCDVVVASESAAFVQAFSKIGLIPDCGGTYFLPRLIGWQKASALAMLAEKISAAEAERLGMIYKVFADDVFEMESRKLATQLAQMPTRGLAFTKQAFQRSLDNSLEQQLQVEEALQVEAGKTADCREGVMAFIEKRQPVFRGA